MSCCNSTPVRETACCAPAPESGCCAPDAETIHEKVREGYARIATGAGAAGTAGGCCGGKRENSGDPARLAAVVGYDVADLDALPEGANLGLSCGNPVALAALRPGQVVLDLGSGGGFDVFIAGRKVGPTGRAIGVDMTPEMISRARRNTEAYRQAGGPDNVEFRLGEIEHLPVADASVDVVISNCVINLSPDKPQVWREIARVLKPGGRVAVSDLALLKPLPDSVRGMIEALVGCIAGAVQIGETEQMMRAAGLAAIELKSNSSYIDAMTDWKDPLYRRIVESLPQGERPSDIITSLSVSAVKPA